MGQKASLKVPCTRSTSRYKDQSATQERSLLYLGNLVDRRYALDTYAAIRDATISLEQKMTVCETEARSAVNNL